MFLVGFLRAFVVIGWVIIKQGLVPIRRWRARNCCSRIHAGNTLGWAVYIRATQGDRHDFRHLLEVNPATVFEWLGILVDLEELHPLLFHLGANVSASRVTPSPAGLALDSLDCTKDATKL